MDDERLFTLSVWMQAVFSVLVLGAIIVAALLDGNRGAFNLAVVSGMATIAANALGQWSIALRYDAIRWLGLMFWLAACILAICALVVL